MRRLILIEWHWPDVCSADGLILHGVGQYQGVVGVATGCPCFDPRLSGLNKITRDSETLPQKNSR